MFGLKVKLFLFYGACVGMYTIMKRADVEILQEEEYYLLVTANSILSK